MKADFIISFIAQLCGLNIKDPNFETLLPYSWPDSGARCPPLSARYWKMGTGI